jgi:hypothetical protein
MAKEPVKVSKVVDGRELTGEALYDFGGDLKGAIDLFGEKVVYEVFKGGAMVKVQNPLRRLLEQGATDVELQDYADKYMLGQRHLGIPDTEKAFLEKFKRMSPEEKAKTLEKLGAHR